MSQRSNEFDGRLPRQAPYAALRAADLRHLWHPFTPIDDFEARSFPIIARARGVWLHDVRGHAVLDGISSWWCVNLGHGHPRIVAAIRAQAGVLQHAILGGMSHGGAVRLAARLAACTPAGLERVYFCGDGASATEAAMRMAIEFWYHQGQPGKHGIVALSGGYHGDTRGAVGAGYVEAFHAPLKASLVRARTARSPHCFICPDRRRCRLQCFDSMRRLVERHHARTAAVILEPLCQGAAGMRIYPAEYLVRLRALCDAHDVLWIADEIAVGFGRSGRMFACDHAGVAPDLLCLGKGLTGGMLPMSAVVCRPRIHDAFRGQSQGGSARTFFHGHTFGGNPLAAAAALAALDLYEEPAFWPRIAARSAQLAEGLQRLAAHPAVSATRALGLMSAVRMAGGPPAAQAAAARAWDLGLLIRPLGEILYLWPPLVTSAADLDRMLDRFGRALD